MYIVKRKVNETVVVGNVAIQILSANCGEREVKLGVVAPRRVEIKKIPSLVELAKQTQEHDDRDLWIDDGSDEEEEEE